MQEGRKEDLPAGARPALPLLGLLALAAALGVAAAVGLAGIALVLAAPAYGAVAEHRKLMCSPSGSLSQDFQLPEPAEEAEDDESGVRYAVLIVVPSRQPGIRQWQM
jgi:hypothetical protein